MPPPIQIQKVPSGSIDLLISPEGPILQFNCDCLDAHPICKGICCRNRPEYSCALDTPEDIQNFKTIPHPHIPEVQLLPHKNGRCIHQAPNGLCEIHGKKPSICGRWHCSPKGGYEEWPALPIEIRDQGFKLIPALGDLQHDWIEKTHPQAQKPSPRP